MNYEILRIERDHQFYEYQFISPTPSTQENMLMNSFSYKTSGHLCLPNASVPIIKQE